MNGGAPAPGEAVDLKGPAKRMPRVRPRQCSRQGAHRSFTIQFLRAKRVWDRAEEGDSGIRNSGCFSLSQSDIQPGKQVDGRIDRREDHQKSKFECDVIDKRMDGDGV